MYKLYAPIMNNTFTKGQRKIYLKQIKAGKIQRIFLCQDRCFDRERSKEIAKSINDNIDYLKGHGIEGSIWIGSTIGHGGSLTGLEKDPVNSFTLLTTISGHRVSDTYCPLDESFVDSLLAFISELAKTNTDLILLDDDYRLSQHGDGIACACDLHMAMIRDELKEDIDREILCKKAFFGRPNKYRDAWLKVQAFSLTNLARRIREAVDKINPDINIAICSASSIWNIDGTDPKELARILAGNNKIFMRLHGAPYPALLNNESLAIHIERARAFVSFFSESDTELIAEGDVYPRPRTRIPASYLELFDAAIRADASYRGILKYMFDYTSLASYETGYIDHHIENLNIMEKIAPLFKGKKQAGLRVAIKPHFLKDASLISDNPWILQSSPEAYGAFMLAMSSIPTTFKEEGLCQIVCGNQADVTNLGNNIILDGLAGAILYSKGYDIGIESIEGFETKHINYEYFLDQKEKINYFSTQANILRATLKEDAIILSRASLSSSPSALSHTLDSSKLDEEVLAYRYKAKDGRNFLVYTFDIEKTNLQIVNSYARQRQLIENIEDMTGKQLPVKCLKHPNLYIICARDEKSMAVGLLNCFADRILKPVIEIDSEYKMIHCLNTSGSLKGNRVYLDTIGPYSFAFFELSI